jgi:hypothetical protein
MLDKIIVNICRFRRGCFTFCALSLPVIRSGHCATGLEVPARDSRMHIACGCSRFGEKSVPQRLDGQDMARRASQRLHWYSESALPLVPQASRLASNKLCLVD